MSVRCWASEQQASGISTELDLCTSAHYDEIKSLEQEWGRRVGVGRRGKKEKENRKGMGGGQSLFTSKGFVIYCFYSLFPLASMITEVH